MKQVIIKILKEFIDKLESQEQTKEEQEAIMEEFAKIIEESSKKSNKYC